MIKINYASLKELSVARSIYKKVFRKYETSLTFKYFLKLLNRDRIKRKEILLAHDGKKPVGLLSLTHITPTFPKAVFLEDLAIIAEYQGKGIGRMMVNKSLKLAKAKGSRRAFACTWPENTAAINFNKKLGFKYCGKIIKAAGENEDYIFFSKKL